MRWRKRYPKKDGDIIYSIRKNCRFDYENDNDNSLPKEERMSEKTFNIKL